MADRWDEFVPERKIGFLSALSAGENGPYMFYQIAPKGVMGIYLQVGLKEFSAADVERVFQPMDRMIEQLLDRDVDIIVQGGVPLPILIGLEAHDELMARMAAKAGIPVTSSVTSITAAAKHMGLKKIVVANKWSEEMNASLARFFARVDVEIVGVCNESLTPDKFLRMTTRDSIELAYELGRRAIEANPGCDGLYIGGGAWLALPVVAALEEEFGITCISQAEAVLWNTLHMVDFWKPIPGFNRLLASQ